MPGILLIAGGHETARRVYRTEHRGYWSAALPLMLEKHGYLDLAVEGPEVLRDPEVFDRAAVTLVARQLDDVWTPELAECARAARGSVIVEGPLAPPVAVTLGVEAGDAYGAEGSIAISLQTLRDATKRHSEISSCRIGLGTSRQVVHNPELDWTVLPVPISPAQAAAWRAPGWDSERWTRVATGTSVLVEWLPADGRDRTPAIVARDGLVGCCFGLFAFLGQSHTVEPFDGMEFRTWPRVEGVEAILLGLIDLAHARSGVTRARLLPWPDGVGWVLNVRHDVDRPPTPADAVDLVRRHAAVGTSATLYWRARHLRTRRGKPSARHGGNQALQLIAAESRHEVALHTERTWAGAERELEVVTAVAGRAIRGTSAHGDATCFRFQGAPNVLWAESMGMAYTELITHSHWLPHRYASLADDGNIRPLDLICLPHHESFERSATAGETLEDEVDAAIVRYIRHGGFVQVLNHPDINLDALFDVLGRRRGHGRADWTAGRLADWWRVSHVADRVSLSASGRTFSASFSDPAPGAQVELLRPDGTIEVRPATDAVASSVNTEKPEYKARPMPITPRSASAYAGRTPSWYEPYLQRFTPLQPPLLDLGCGFGLLLELARDRNVAATGLEFEASRVSDCQARGLDVRRHDLGQPFPLPDNSFGMIYCGQVIEHVPEPVKLNIFREALRVLRPGGQFQVCSPCRHWEGAWEPDHNYLITPRELLALLHQAGWENVVSLDYPQQVPEIPSDVMAEIWTRYRPDVLSQSASALCTKL